MHRTEPRFNELLDLTNRWNCKTFKMIQKNVVVVGLTISMHFQQCGIKNLKKLSDQYAPGPS